MKQSPWLRCGVMGLLAGGALASCEGGHDDGHAGPALEPVAAAPGESAAARATTDALRARFREPLGSRRGDRLAGERPVLGSGVVAAFDRDAAGLRPRSSAALPTSMPRPARVTLPASAQGSFELVDVTSSMRVAVALPDAAPAAAEVAGGYVVYRGALPGADVVHRPTAGGTEDFVAFEQAPAREEVRYRVTLAEGVAGLRLVAGTLELVDAEGAPRLRMAPPYVASADGARHAASAALLAALGLGRGRRRAARGLARTTERPNV